MTAESRRCHWPMRLTVLVLFLVSGGRANVTYLRIGIILGTGNDAPYDMERSGAAIDLAVEKVNDEILNASYQIETVKKTFTNGCDASRSAGKSHVTYGDCKNSKPPDNSGTFLRSYLIYSSTCSFTHRFDLRPYISGVTRAEAK